MPNLKTLLTAIPLPEQTGWAVEMHGAAVLFATNAEKAAGMSPGAQTQIFTADQLRADRLAVAEMVARDCAALCMKHASADKAVAAIRERYGVKP
jgi:phosphoribosylformylglycinamidine (FGAM) synthase-like enzyme